jgi:hypothetical protein
VFQLIRFKAFQRIVWANYLGGISEAIQDLMRKAVEQHPKESKE